MGVTVMRASDGRERIEAPKTPNEPCWDCYPERGTLLTYDPRAIICLRWITSSWEYVSILQNTLVRNERRTRSTTYVTSRRWLNLHYTRCSYGYQNYKFTLPVSSETLKNFAANGNRQYFPLESQLVMHFRSPGSTIELHYCYIFLLKLHTFEITSSIPSVLLLWFITPRSAHKASSVFFLSLIW